MLRRASSLLRSAPPRFTGQATLRRHKLDLCDSLATKKGTRGAPLLASSSAPPTAFPDGEGAEALRWRHRQRKASLEAVPQDELEADARHWISEARRSASWAAAAAVLHAAIAKKAPHLPPVIEAATSVMVMARAVESSGMSQRDALVSVLGGGRDVIDGESVAHWPLEPEEVRAVATQIVAAQRRNLLTWTPRLALSGRFAHGGSAGGADEAASTADDRFAVNLLHAVEQRSAEDGTDGLLPIGALANLAQLRVSWKTSLRLLQAVRHQGLVPLSEMYAECVVKARSARRWADALRAFVDCVESGLEPTPDAYAFVCAALADEAMFSFSQRRGALPATHLWEAATWVWRVAAGAVEAGELALCGEEGAAVLSQATLLAATMRRWATALRFLSAMDLDPRPSYRALIPSADAVLHCLACCIASERSRESTLLSKAAVALDSFFGASPRARIAVLLASVALPRSTSLEFRLVEGVVAQLLELHEGRRTVLGHDELEAVAAALQAASRKVFWDLQTRPSVWELATRAYVAKECLPDLPPPQNAEEYRQRLAGSAAFARALESSLEATRAFCEYNAEVHGGQALYDVYFTPMRLRAAARAGNWAEAMACFAAIAAHPLRHLLEGSTRQFAERVAASFARDAHQRAEHLPAFLAAALPLPQSPQPHNTLLVVLLQATREEMEAAEAADLLREGSTDDGEEADAALVAAASPPEPASLNGASWMAAVQRFASGTTDDALRPYAHLTSAGRLVRLLHARRDEPPTAPAFARHEAALVAHHPRLFRAWALGAQRLRHGPLLAELL